jgi:uncharacterized protein
LVAVKIVLAGGSGSLGRRILGTDPALALTGRRCVPARLLEAGFTSTYPRLDASLENLLSNRSG